MTFLNKGRLEMSVGHFKRTVSQYYIATEGSLMPYPQDFTIKH
nr:hypothetical protein [uncultured Porphyromonas sp.]